MWNSIDRLNERMNRVLWGDDLRLLTGARHHLLLFVRLLVILLSHLTHGQLTLRAMSLVYTTLLSVVPLLAVSFSVLKAFGVHNEIEPLLLHVLAPLGAKGPELAANIIGFVENVKVGVLGSLGLVLLLYTVVSLTQKVESAFNFVWGVERMRGFAERVSSYLTVILLGPVLIFSALGLTATVSSYGVTQWLLGLQPFGTLFVLVGKLLPYLIVIIVFTFLYLVFPNTRVRFVPALIGGTIAGALWETSGWGFAVFIAGSSKYAAIYSGFAILVLLLIWVYLSWLILLVGSQVAFYVQYPQYLTRNPRLFDLSQRLTERLALAVMALVAERHLRGDQPWTPDTLAKHLHLPVQPVHKVLQLLFETGFLAATDRVPPELLPRHDIDSIALVDLLRVLRDAGESPVLAHAGSPDIESVSRLLAAADAAVDQVLEGKTVRDLVQDKPAAPAA